jgi:predicted methyltransferase
MARLLVLSYIQAGALLDAHAAGQDTATVSPDLGLSTVPVALDAAGARFPTGETVTWADLARIREATRKCFLVEGDQVTEIAVFSETTGWLRSLMPTTGAPTMLVSGISMHRFKGIDPYEDTLRKVKTIAPLTGRVLDTATGLGYTAIEAAKTATEVVTIELDPAGLEVARYNPWSQALFENPRIRQVVGDAYDEVAALPAGSFSRIIHDPPAFSLAGDLYSGTFYGELFRVLARGGRLFHYIGDLESKSGHRVTAGVIRRLQDAGFKGVLRRPEAFGVVASK